MCRKQQLIIWEGSTTLDNIPKLEKPHKVLILRERVMYALKLQLSTERPTESELFHSLLVKRELLRSIGLLSIDLKFLRIISLIEERASKNEKLYPGPFFLFIESIHFPRIERSESKEKKPIVDIHEFSIPDIRK